MDTFGHAVPQARIDHLKDVVARIPVCQNLGFELVAVTQGCCTLKVPQPHRYDGIYGAFHGGLLATVADSVAWFAIATALGADELLTTADLNIRYLSSCFGAVTAEAEVIKIGRSLCPVAVNLRNDEGRHVAVAQVTYFRVDALPDRPNVKDPHAS